MAASTVSSWVPPSLPESATPPGLALLDKGCYIADLPNNTTAESTTSNGFPIKVTLRAARPPLLSHFCVHCPDLEFRRIGPKIVTTDADLVLLCVPVVPGSTFTWDWDYFVYSPRARWLDRIPNPEHPWGGGGGLHDSATALISRDDGAWYAVAALGYRPPMYDGRVLISWEFDLHLYRSSDSKGWISKRMSVTEFERDKLIPLPRSGDRFYHETGKTITIGGEHGTVAWVDLWRGIFFCDVLRECPVLQDVPLPAPARANWGRLLQQCDPIYLRDVAISSRNKGLMIKYIEMEFCEQEELMVNATPPPVSYVDWVRYMNTRKKSVRVIRDGWKSTTWSMTIPVIGSSECCSWHPDCVFDVKDVISEASDDPCLPDLMAALSSKTSRTLKELPVGYPILSMDDDVVYLISQTRTRHMDKLAVMLAIDVKKATLRGLAELDAQKSSIFWPNFCTSAIFRG